MAQSRYLEILAVVVRVRQLAAALPSRQRLSGLSYSTVEKVTRNLYRATIPGANTHRGANHLHSQSKRAKPAERVHSLSPLRLLCAGRVKSALRWKPGYLQVNWILLQVLQEIRDRATPDRSYSCRTGMIWVCQGVNCGACSSPGPGSCTPPQMKSYSCQIRAN